MRIEGGVRYHALQRSSVLLVVPIVDHETQAVDSKKPKNNSDCQFEGRLKKIALHRCNECPDEICAKRLFNGNCDHLEIWRGEKIKQSHDMHTLYVWTSPNKSGFIVLKISWWSIKTWEARFRIQGNLIQNRYSCPRDNIFKTSRHPSWGELQSPIFPILRAKQAKINNQ